MTASIDYMGATSLKPSRLFQGFLPTATEQAIYTVPTDGTVGFVVVKNIRLANTQSAASQPIIGIIPNGYTITLSGLPTGGTFTPTVTVPGGSAVTLAAQPYNVTPLALQAAFAAAVGAGKVQVHGTQATTSQNGLFIITFAGTALGSTVSVTSALTGGTTPTATAAVTAPSSSNGKAFHILDTLGSGIAANDALDDSPNQVLFPGDSLSGFQFPANQRITAVIWGLVGA